MRRDPYVWIDPWAEFDRWEKGADLRRELAKITGTSYEDMSRQPPQRPETGIEYTTRIGLERLRKWRPTGVERHIITPITEDEAVGQHRTGRLPADLTVWDISRVIGFPPNHKDDQRKVKHSWGFSIDGVNCGIWDYYDARWSIYDPQGLVRRLFGLEEDQ